MPFRLCHHILPTGRQCHSPAKRDQAYCFHHARLYCQGSGFRAANLAHTFGKPLPLIPLHNQASVVKAASLICSALAEGRLDCKRAGALLFSLQTASKAFSE
jgi:hypothetical protein